MNQHSDFPQNRPLRSRLRLTIFATGVACYFLSIVAAWTPGLTDVAYGRWMGPLVARWLSLLTGVISISLAEVFVLGVILRQLVGGSVAVVQVGRRQRHWTNAASAALLRLAQDAGALLALFYVLWGFNYSRPSLQDRLGWTLGSDAPVEELVALTSQLVEASNAAYREIHGVADAGTPTTLPMDRRTLGVSLEQGWVIGRSDLGLPLLSGHYGTAKTPLLTRWYEWLGIAGFYFPFTGEANLRAGIPAIDVPKMLGHEQAHQRGAAREAEANFWGYISSANAPDPYARYSAYVFAQLQLMSALRQADPNQFSQIVSAMLPGIRRDIEESRKYWVSFRGRGTKIGTKVNNAYLRSNRVTGGVRNYSMSLLLFIAYARAHGGRLVPTNAELSDGS